MMDLPFLLDTRTDGLRGAGLRLRRARSSDRSFLGALYAEGRAPELGGLSWTSDEKARFLEQQFALQERHIMLHHPLGDRLVIEDSGVRPASIGRIYIDRTTSPWRLIEFALSIHRQSRGLGGLLIHWLQHLAHDAGAEIDLHVVLENVRATKFYEKHGFIEVETRSPVHRRLEWRAPSDPSLPMAASLTQRNRRSALVRSCRPSMETTVP